MNVSFIVLYDLIWICRRACVSEVPFDRLGGEGCSVVQYIK